MWALGIETSTSKGTVALVAESGDVLERELDVAGRHGDVIVPAVRDLLVRASIAMADVGLVAAGIGPGSFTGVRAALAVAKGLVLATSIPIAGITSLEALARPAATRDPAAHVLAMVDARRGELFAALVDPHGALRVAPIAGAADVIGATMARSLDRPSRVVVIADTDVASLVAPVRGALVDHVVHVSAIAVPRAAEVARLALARHARGDHDDAGVLAPLYVRGADAKLPPPPRWSRPGTS